MRSRAKTALREFDSLSNLEVEPFSGTLTPRRACLPSTLRRPAWHLWRNCFGKFQHLCCLLNS